MGKKDLNEFFDKIISVRKDIQKLIKDFNIVSMEKVRNRFLYLASQYRKKTDAGTDKRKLVELIEESIEMVQRHIDYVEIAGDFRQPDEKFEEKEERKRLRDRETELKDEVERDAWPELDKIITYIRENRNELVWDWMANNPKSGLWELVGDIGTKPFERLFMAKARAGGQKPEFPSEKELWNEGKLSTARRMKEKFPSAPLKSIIEMINSKYPGKPVGEREIKYWLYEKEFEKKEELPLSPGDSNLRMVIEFDDNLEINTKMFNAIQRRLFDERLQEILKERVSPKREK